MLVHDPSRDAYWRSRLKETPWVLDNEARSLTLQAILTVCTHRKWMAHAVHVRTTHVHAVIDGEAPPERMLSGFKALPLAHFAAKALEFSTAATGQITEARATSGMKQASKPPSSMC